ncbi:MAG TPA: hypothetical protein ENH44_04115, partial [Actinobacteria bacterium]|nr:hypothetical protein [Actinomycetota bacterium]
LALRLRERFGGEACLPRCQSLGCGHCSPFDDLARALPERFAAGDGSDALVCVMAAGIVFRLLAPELRSKQEDPAVIVVDEEGRFAVPLLGGHAAGANDLAREMARYLEGEAVLTTASDARGLTAPDQVAERLGPRVADPESLRRVTALLVDGKPVCLEAPSDPGCGDYDWIPPGGDLKAYDGRLLVTHEDAGRREDILTARLVPPVVAAGVGCRRGAAAAEILRAIDEACAGQGVDRLAVGVLASVDTKQDEEGLLEAAAALDAELRWYDAGRLAALGRPGSDFVRRQVGTPAVAEPAALLAAGEDARMLAGKAAYGAVTVALALGSRDRSLPREGEEGAAGGEVTVVGIGAGTGALLTKEAARVLEAADTVVGYRTYIEQVKKILSGDNRDGKRYVSGSMGRERQRCREALAAAAAGQRVALVSSGDPGVYGMAGLLLEMAGDTPVAVAPGITAAQMAAARLGAPLMNDYITLSLSDLLTPREEVLRRAEAAAAADM